MAANAKNLVSTPKITVTNVERVQMTKTKVIPEPKSPDTISALMAKKSLTSMSDEEIIQENLKEILDKKSREERKANGRLVAFILAFLVIFLAVYHAWIRKTAPLAGMVVPAGIMLSYGAWIVILAKRDKHKRALFERHIEEVALKKKSDLEHKHPRVKRTDEQQLESNCSGSSLQFVNELAPGGEHRKKTRRHRPRQREQAPEAGMAEVTVHRSGGVKRPSIRQKLFGQNITHVKLVEVNADEGMQQMEAQSALTEKRKRLQRMDTLAAPQVIRMNSAP